MKRLLSSLTLLIAFTFAGLMPAFAVTVSSNAVAAGALPALSLNPRETATYTLTGNFTGSIRLEASRDGVNYSPLPITATSSTTLTGTIYNDSQATFYRWNVLTRTTGTFSVELRDNDDFVDQKVGSKNTPMVKYYDDSLRIPQFLLYEIGSTLALSSATSLNQDNLPRTMNVITSTGGPLVLSAVPTISTTPYTNGTIYVVQSATNTVTFQDNDTLAGSLLELGSTTRALGVGDILVLIYRAGKWWEFGFYNN